MKSIYTSNIISPKCCFEKTVFPIYGIQHLFTSFSRVNNLSKSMADSDAVYKVNHNSFLGMDIPLTNGSSNTQNMAKNFYVFKHGILLTNNKNL
ncbi:hypothetical protein [Maribacter dokdonensis]|uniref:hypothetical protein n=1 Tax=Maribacter dokdonensis TaxID=320912 RepID=UPI0012FA4DE1|nr:hypothetical protein [Maribacter dokdonensis]MDP2527945.1 hypothetical protein [Maribacter dokdonensis]